MAVKRVVQVKLLPDGEQDQALRETLHLCNRMANVVSQVAHERNINSGYDLRAVTYGQIKPIIGGAQTAQQVIRKVTQARKTFRANLRSGNYGKRGSRRRIKAEQEALSFRPTAAQPYDDRILSWKHDQQTVSIWTVHGRLHVPFTGNPDHLAMVAEHRKGESDLIEREGMFYLMVTVDLPTPDVRPPQGFVGVDMGIVTIAATATEDGQTGRDWSGGAVTARRKRNRRLRQRLQKKGTKSAKRLLKHRSRKESRFAADVNHQVSKQIVAEAKRTGRGVAVEHLTGIRSRVRQRKPQRANLHSWSFAQLGAFLAYKCEAAGVAFVQVDPRHTSQQCSQCGYIDRNNRTTQASFACRSCGFSLNADTNAAINIARRGVDGWVAVNLPDADCAVDSSLHGRRAASPLL